ncbi:MAG: MBL fold metallo-hydrolase [Spirochaetales bacterium]|nr:MBL fold metallo-hydrolase [Spirochaetales bacterium]
MEIILLSENLTYKSFLRSEHGFSALIRHKGKKILFDTGASELFYENAVAMQVDLTDVGTLILSHAHYDHCGGVKKLLEINPKINIVTGPNFFHKKYSKNSVYRGINFLNEEITNHCEVSEPTEILDGLYVFPKPKIINKFDTHYASMTKEIDGKFIQDDFEEEIFLCIKENEKILLINGCAHNGITNSMLACRDYFGKFPTDILGGCHMLNENPQTIDKITEFLLESKSNFHLCHCTGVDFFAKLRAKTENCDYMSCGNQLTL